MIKIILTIVVGILLGGISSYILLTQTQFEKAIQKEKSVLEAQIHKKEIIGFLPFWLLDKTDNDYSSYITTLTYFGLTIDDDGSIQKFVNDTEEEPGWHSLRSGKLNPFLSNARKNNIKTSLLVFSGNNTSIDALVSHPIDHAKNLTNEVIPIMKKYNFSDLNLDIESTKDASPSATAAFSLFVKQVRRELKEKTNYTLSIDVTAGSFVRDELIIPAAIEEFVDSIIIMAYDFHFTGSYVTGPVAPLYGAETVAELDTATAVKEALKKISSEKIILGVPLYGYGWETLGKTPRSAVLPGSGVIATTQRLETILSSCASCSAQIDNDAKESYVVYKDSETGTYHQFFYPTQKSMTEKLQYVSDKQLGGIALWALGYEDSTILKPLELYK